MDTLALLGGSKAVTLSYEALATRPLVTPEAKAAVNALLDKGEISMSPTVRAFERAFADYVGAKYAVAMNNGTSTLDSALFALSVAPGDEVLVPSYTFWATVAPIIAQHATPVFVEADPETFCIDVADMERKLTPKTKAIMVVHVWGNPADMDAVTAFAKKHHLGVIEDCSHAHGASYGGRKVGVLGDVGCFSLQGSKPLVAGEGGILVTNSREVYERAVTLGHYELINALPEDSTYRQYALTGMGHKYRAHPLGIAIAACELKTLDERNAIREKNALRLEKGVRDIPFLKAQRVYPGAKRIYSYQYMRYLPELAQGVSIFGYTRALHAEGVACGLCGYGRLHLAPLFTQGGPYGDCGGVHTSAPMPVTEKLGQNTFLGAPRFENDCPELVDQYIAAYRKVAENLPALKQYDAGQDYQSVKDQMTGRSIMML
ncbi:MAG: DegT/DnrJ/EryC1/StrS family aminotransferase [Eubacteriales bacterium]|nr:DegT/DnrJ/EryC1/StrS family aminotransferase [Eubacteriales bacterium]